MKLSIGTKIKKSAWGGGNNFATNLANFLKKKGIEVFFDLKQQDLDFIILTDPRAESMSSSFNDLDIINYQLKFKKTLVIHRLNECDERKNTINVNRQLLHSNRVADHTVFVSKWLKNIYSNLGFKKQDYSIILNGANRKIFKFNPNSWSSGKLKIVTHHWSNHQNKGAKVYQMIDDLLNQSEWKKKIEFVYIGNVPENIILKNTQIVEPLAGEQLAQVLSTCHIYLTGSINEPGGNHQNEGANIGLPILYLDSGCMEEYCKGYGVAFKYENFETKLNEIIDNYFEIRKVMKGYPYYSEKMCDEYYNLILKMQENKKNILSEKIIPNLSLIEKMKIFKKRILIS